MEEQNNDNAGGSLLGTAAPSTESVTETPPSEPTSWNYADNLPGEGERPDWFKSDKYKSVADQAKAYGELEKKLGSFTGAPEGDYEITVPEEVGGVQVEEIAADPRVAAFMEVAKNSNMSQEGFTRALHAMIQAEADSRATSHDTELSRLGEHAQERLQAISNFYGQNQSAEDYEITREIASTAAGVEWLERQMQFQKSSSKLPVTSAPPSPILSGDALRSSIDYKRMASDPAYRKEVQAKYNDAYGNAPPRNVVG